MERRKILAELPRFCLINSNIEIEISFLINSEIVTPLEITHQGYYKKYISLNHTIRCLRSSLLLILGKALKQTVDLKVIRLNTPDLNH